MRYQYSVISTIRGDKEPVEVNYGKDLTDLAEAMTSAMMALNDHRQDRRIALRSLHTLSVRIEITEVED